MQEFSTVDGFVEVTECMAEMIKYVANEPSVGLFYIQQHIQNAAPNLINLKNNVVEKSHEMTLHTEDFEDSISAISSMKECGFLIADEMIRDINSSLTIISKKHPKRGLMNSTASAFQLGRTRSWGPVVWGRSSSSSLQDSEKSSGYLSSVINSAKLKASNLKWNQTETTNQSFEAIDETSTSDINASSSDACGSTSNMLDSEAVELPISSPIAEELQQVQGEESLRHEDLLSLAHKYEEFKADKEAKLEEWLGEMSIQGTTNT
ncbi:OLC1v1026111C2 [Oldenlandia corymbosa var. corymbosa]|nr:OLC1v1026111C2 [Oldenlandia corymbosa var. corymbosa]